jgi:predicted TIM-barrel fold metal-dependent hydrolase
LTPAVPRCYKRSKLSHGKEIAVVIDIHYHLFDETFHHPEMWDGIAQLCVAFAPRDRPVTAEEAKRKLLPRMFDPTGEVTVRNLDRWGIDVAAVVAVDNGLLHGEGPAGVEGQNKAIADAARRFPDRLVAFLSVDPRRPDAVELVDRCVNDWGMRGLKCHCDTGWYPDDEAYHPYWEKVRELGIPVLTHTGPLEPPSVSECVHPDRLGNLAARFPEITFIAAHMAFRWYKQLVEVAKRHRNIMTDISAWQPTAHESQAKFAHILRGVIDAIGADRVVFGTDAPTFSSLYPEEEWVGMLRDLPATAPGGKKFTRDEVEGILHKNAARVLGL